MGKPQGRSLCVWGVASGSAASHPDPGSSGMVEFSEESRNCGRHRNLPESGRHGVARSTSKWSHGKPRYRTDAWKRRRARCIDLCLVLTPLLSYRGVRLPSTVRVHDPGEVSRQRRRDALWSGLGLGKSALTRCAGRRTGWIESVATPGHPSQSGSPAVDAQGPSAASVQPWGYQLTWKSPVCVPRLP